MNAIPLRRVVKLSLFLSLYPCAALADTSRFSSETGGFSLANASGYRASLAARLGEESPIEYSSKSLRLGFTPVGLAWSTTNDGKVSITESMRQVAGRLIHDAKEIEGGKSRSDSAGTGVIYQNAYGEGLHLGVLAKNFRLRKIVRFDGLGNLGPIPLGAEFLEAAFVVHADDETTFQAAFGGEETRFWDKSETVVATHEAIEIGKTGHHATIRPARAWDDTGRETPLALQLRKENDRLLIVKRIPVEWLRRAVFPVYADFDVSIGSEFVFDSTSITNSVSMTVLDATHVLVAYRAGTGKAIVGTVSGSTVTFGTPVAFGASAMEIHATTLDSTHVLISYRDFGNSSFGTAVVGTISGGDIITFGAEYVFNLASTFGPSATALDATTALIAYRDFGNSDFGTAVVATVSSGDVIAFGPTNVFNTILTGPISTTTLDSTRAVIAYGNNNATGTAIVATIAGNVITYGTAVDFETVTSYRISTTTLDSSRFIVAHRTFAGALEGKVTVGTVSGGNVVAFGTTVVFSSYVPPGEISVAALDSDHAVISYQAGVYGRTMGVTVWSGDVIATSAPVVFQKGATNPSTTLISAAALGSKRMAIAYRDEDNLDYGTLVLGDVVPSPQALIGFETGDGSEMASLSAGGQVQAVTVRSGSGTRSLEEGSTSTLTQAMVPPLDAIGVRFSFRKPTNPAVDQTLLQFRNGVTNLWSLDLKTDGRLQVQQDETLGLTTTPGSISLSNDTWYTIRLSYNAAAGGVLKVWLYGSLEIDVTHTLAGTSIDEIQVSGSASPNQYFYDDFNIGDTADEPSYGQIVRLRANEAGNATQFDSVIGSTFHFENVDELPLPPVVDLDYNQHANTTSAQDLYGLFDFTSDSINAVKGMWRMARGNGGGVGTHDYIWRQDGDTDGLPFTDITTSYTWKDLKWSYPPNTFGPWTASDVTGLELGASHNGTLGQDTFISWAGAMVDYDIITTAVRLTSFITTAGNGEVRLEWQTGSELDNLGFHLYRSTWEEGPYERLTATAIPGLGSSPVGASYSYVDTGLTNGMTYYYELEDIETTGKTELHGPVSATPVAGAASGDGGSDSVSGDGSATSFITYGDPTASSLKILKRGRDHVVLELTTGGFYAAPQEDGSVRLEIPGFESLTEANAPGMPVKRSWIEAIAGRKVKLVSVKARGVQAFTSLRPTDAELFELEATRDGTVRAARSSSPKGTRRRPRVVFQRGELYPSESARVVSVGFQRDVKKALVELAPLRWDGANGQLLLARRLVVRLSFRGREPADRSEDGVRGRRYRRRRSHEARRGVVARLATTNRGLHAVGYEDVFTSRRRVRSRALRLSRQGESVAFHVEPRPNRFEPGSILYFVSEGASSNPYGSEAVYELEVGPSGETMPEISTAPLGERTRFYWNRAEWEVNRYYQAALVDAPDVWLWDLLFAPVVKGYPFEVSALAQSNEASSFSVWLQGVSDFPANPDHHVRVYVNGSMVTELSWDGKQAKKIDVELLPGLLHDGENLLELENVGDTEAAYSMVMLDRFMVEYPRVPLAEEGMLEGRFSQSGMVELTGYASGAHVLDVTPGGSDQPSWLSGTEVGADGTLRFRAESGRSYLTVSADAVYRPVVRKPSSSGLKSARNQADYLLIGPAAFLKAATPLLELRRSQKLKVMAVPIEDIYSSFGFGESTPESIRDFLSYAYHKWERPSPRYVVLLGDATYDYKDYLQTGVLNQVPPLMVKTRYLWTTSDPTYAAVNGDDLLPDLAIGRLPAATIEEARVMVAKIVAYETGEASLEAPAVLIADNADSAGNFEADAEAIASSLLSSREVVKIYLSRLGSAASRSAIIEAFDQGSSVMSYLGHGGIHLWASENVFNIRSVPSLAPQGQQPLLLTINCLNGYFHFPFFNSLSEELVKAEGKGAIAAFSPSGLSLNAPANLYHRVLLHEILNGGHERLGDAVLAAQEAYAESGAFPELLTIYHLLGDPALELR